MTNSADVPCHTARVFHGYEGFYSVDISITDTVSVNAELFRSFRQKIEHNIFYHYIVNDLHVLKVLKSNFTLVYWELKLERSVDNETR